MLVLFGDFESYYSTEYSLRRMSPAEYIMDQRFEAICLGMAGVEGEPMLIEGTEIPELVRKLKERQQNEPIAFVSHNAQFDAAILSWRYDFHPDLLIDTMSLSRTILGPQLYSHSLAGVAKYFKLPDKGTALANVKGMIAADIKASGLWKEFTEYCLHDVWLCREIFRRFADSVSSDELTLHDILTKCCTEPVLRLNKDLLQQHAQRLQLQKEMAIYTVEQMGVTRPDLMSNQKLAGILQSLGVEPPTKISPTTNEKTFAFAKNDADFIELLEHDNILVRTLVEARLETKSTLDQTRTNRFLAISELEFPNLGSCVMPMPVIIGAAHTHRVGGGWDLNVQNLGRGGTLRDAIEAGEGHTLVTVDAKQIEARVTAWFCGQNDLVEQFRQGLDVYSIFASTVFGRAITSKDVTERFVGKTGILQLGYACGWVKYQNTVKMLSRKSETPIEMADEMAVEVVDKYRKTYSRITYKWRELDHILQIMYSLPELIGLTGTPDGGVVMGPVQFFRNAMVGPTGLVIRFPELHFNDTENSWYFRDGKHLRRTYGASLLETIAQHLSRCIVMMAAVRLETPMANIGGRLVHTAHDELVYRVPDRHVETAKLWVELEMNRVPGWAAGLPLACDVGSGYSYGAAK